MGTSFFDWATSEIITASRLNGPYDGSGNLDLGGGNKTVGVSGTEIGALYLDNTSTDGGAIYFDATTTKFIKSSADGATLSIDGFTNVGIGLTSAGFPLEIDAQLTQTIALSNTDVAHGITAQVQTDVAAVYGIISVTAGGAFIQGISDSDANAFRVDAFIGSTNPTDTVPAILLQGAKKLTTNVQALANGETVLQVQNNGTELMTILGDANVGIGIVTPTGQLHIDQSSASGAKPVLRLNQTDIDDTFVDFVGTSAADGTRSISSDTTEDGAKFGAYRVEINGVTKWVRVYDDES